MRVQQFYNRNQFLLSDEHGAKVFQSYNSTIAKIDRNGVLTLSNRFDEYIKQCKTDKLIDKALKQVNEIYGA